MGYPTISNYARAYVRARAEAHMNCTVKITRGQRPAYLDRSTGLVTAATANVIYTGKARLWSLDKNSNVNIMETDLVTQNVYISVPWKVAPHNDDIVVVTVCPGDADVVGRAFRVIGQDGAALTRATRRLTCVTLGENRSWDG